LLRWFCGVLGIRLCLNIGFTQDCGDHEKSEDKERGKFSTRRRWSGICRAGSALHHF
jgi:hypothetical protein